MPLKVGIAPVTEIDALRKGAPIHEACRRANISRQTLHYARLHDRTFAEACALAVELVDDSIHLEALRRGRDGLQKAQFHKGEPLGDVTQYSDRLLISLMKNLRPQNPG